MILYRTEEVRPVNEGPMRARFAHPEFALALKIGKDPPDDRTERSLYHRANGYTYDSEEIFFPAGCKELVRVPPDVTACIFWLKNRRPDRWRDRKDIDVTSKTVSDGRSVRFPVPSAPLQGKALPRLATGPRALRLPSIR